MVDKFNFVTHISHSLITKDAMSKSIIKEKTFRFAVRIIKLSAYLNQNKCDSSLSKQVLRSGTNPGEMIAESKYAQSAADFIHKLSIA